VSQNIADKTDAEVISNRIGQRTGREDWSWASDLNQGHIGSALRYLRRYHSGTICQRTTCRAVRINYNLVYFTCPEILLAPTIESYLTFKRPCRN
jgi:hypothetical protein